MSQRSARFFCRLFFTAHSKTALNEGIHRIVMNATRAIHRQSFTLILAWDRTGRQVQTQLLTARSDESKTYRDVRSFTTMPWRLFKFGQVWGMCHTGTRSRNQTTITGNNVAIPAWCGSLVCNGPRSNVRATTSHVASGLVNLTRHIDIKPYCSVLDPTVHIVHAQKIKMADYLWPIPTVIEVNTSSAVNVQHEKRSCDNVFGCRYPLNVGLADFNHTVETWTDLASGAWNLTDLII